jgi:hypothetical protein
VDSFNINQNRTRTQTQTDTLQSPPIHQHNRIPYISRIPVRSKPRNTTKRTQEEEREDGKGEYGKKSIGRRTEEGMRRRRMGIEKGEYNIR